MLIYPFLTIFLVLLNLIFCESHAKISIIIPFYNSEQYLERCIQSALNQTLKEIEVLCIDDASTDNSLKILRKYQEKDNRIKIIQLKENNGPSLARNIGIEKSTGEFIGFIDSDDYVDKKFFENLYDHSNNYDIVVGKYVRSTNNSNRYILLMYKNFHGSVGDSIWRRIFINDHNIRFNKTKKYGEDTKFRYDCYKFNPRLLELPDEGIYYYYKMRVGSLSKFSKRFIKYFTNIINNYKSM